MVPTAFELALLSASSDGAHGKCCKRGSSSYLGKLSVLYLLLHGAGSKSAPADGTLPYRENSRKFTIHNIKVLCMVNFPQSNKIEASVHLYDGTEMSPLVRAFRWRWFPTFDPSKFSAFEMSTKMTGLDCS